MKQFQTTYEGKESFAFWLKELKKYSCENHLDHCAKLFYLSTDSIDRQRVIPVTEALREEFPEAVYAGSSGNGGICEGELVLGQISVSAIFFEKSSTHAEVLQFPITHDTQYETAQALIGAVTARPWVKAVEMMTTIGNVNMPKFCDDISALPEEIRLFGGGALARDTHDGTSSLTFVFSSAGAPTTFNGVFILLGGEDFHLDTRFITGWKGLGLPFRVTGAEKNILKTLDGKPAFEVFQKYLQVPDEEQHFFDMAVVFPFSFDSEDGSYLRVSTQHFPDGSLAIASDIEEQTLANIAYGDPAFIRQSVLENAASVRAFAPEVIRFYSCASRQYYWGDDTVSLETRPFEKIASTSGFYTSGEFLRAKHKVLLHNVSIVVAAFREGAPNLKELPVEEEKPLPFSRQIMINLCLTTFINATTERLVEANQKLTELAITDGLTGLFKREEIERRIEQALKEYHAKSADPEGASQKETAKLAAPPTLLMIDLDNFKHINDTYGHREGDEVLRRVAQIFRDCSLAAGINASIGRWGGEEFMILLEEVTAEEAKKLADSIRTTFAAYEFPQSGKHTLSAGVTAALPEDSTDSFCNRADMGLYKAKKDGKNLSVII